MFGREHEVVAKTTVDSHKAETPANHWRMTAHGPDEEKAELQPPTEGQTESARA